jgi:hypothetical protein
VRHRETWAIRRKDFRRWLARRHFEATGGAPNSEALQSALNVIEARALFDAPERTVMFASAASTTGFILTSGMRHGGRWKLMKPAGA